MTLLQNLEGKIKPFSPEATFLTERRMAFTSLDYNDLQAFFKRYGIQAPADRFVFWTWCYFANICSNLGDESSVIRSNIWLENNQLRFIRMRRKDLFDWDAERKRITVHGEIYFIHPLLTVQPQ